MYTFLCIEIERLIQGLFKPWFYSFCKMSENYIFSILYRGIIDISIISCIQTDRGDM